MTTQPSDPSASPARRIERLLDADPASFLREAYLVLLGRSLDTAGERFYSARLGSGTERLEILRELAGSDEGRQHLAANADLAAALAAKLGVKTARADSVAALMALSHREFVEQVFPSVLGTPGDPQSLALIDAQLRGGTPRADIIARLADARRPSKAAPDLAGLEALLTRWRDPEQPLVRDLQELMALQDEAFIGAAYRALFGRSPDPAGLHHYMGLLAEGHSRHRVIAELASSSEARARPQSLPGVERVRSTRRWVRLPLLGPLVAWLTGIESESDSARRRRMLEALVRRSYRLESRLHRLQAGSPTRGDSALPGASRSQQRLEADVMARLEAMIDIQRDSFDREMNAIRKLVLQAESSDRVAPPRQSRPGRRGRR